MFDSKLFSQTLAVSLFTLASITSVSAVCGVGNQIGFGTTSSGDSVIVATNCGVIDSKSGGICEGYDQLSYAICDHDAGVASAQTYDGRNWANCISSTETCGSTQIKYCCS